MVNSSRDQSQQRPCENAEAAARDCDSCGQRRARWYCAADDAFLCDGCDGSVHSANPLARRHHRLRLKPPSPESAPAWHKGFKRKLRTPRPRPESKPAKSDPLVPDLEALLDGSHTEEEEELIYQVPIFDPALSEFFSPFPELPELSPVSGSATECVSGFHPSELEIEEFAADVERLLGCGCVDEERYCIDALVGSSADNIEAVKMEAEEGNSADFEYGWPIEEVEGMKEEDEGLLGAEGTERFTLRLDYEAVMAEWKSGSPWNEGERPLIDDSFIVEGSDPLVVDDGHHYNHHGLRDDGGRVARVTRYREKRRTRLFSKKIRYEVRKLNAEKRPRMKGRFVKRTTLINHNTATTFRH